MKDDKRVAFIATLATLAAVLTFMASRLLPIGKYITWPYLTAEAYGTILGGCLAGFLLGAVDPKRAFGWAALIGGIHFIMGLGYLMIQFGTAALDPLSLGLLALMSFPPPILGGILGDAAGRLGRAGSR